MRMLLGFSMRTREQYRKHKRERIAVQYKLAIQQQQISARFYKMARDYYERKDFYNAKLYQLEGQLRHDYAKMHIVRANWDANNY